ncbi:MAG TPA: RNA methyltransferase [Ignavibacteria bacterium]|nr:RNA methyltransferase [Ignavibacteria bacterium]
MTSKRFIKIKDVVSKRQKYFTIVLENIHDPHNVSAILRSADSVGIDKIYLIYNTNKFPKIGRISSGSAKKWIEIERFSNAENCFRRLKEEKFKIYSTSISEKRKNHSLFDLDLSKRIAIVFGNEHTGVSDEVKQLADKNFLIPMYGMVQSLNVSVAVAICLYEGLRQRELKGMYLKTKYSKKEINEKLEIYSKK